MSLLNAAAVRKRALELGKAKEFTQVSPRFTAALERRVDDLIISAMHRHPSRGQTVRDFNP